MKELLKVSGHPLRFSKQIIVKPRLTISEPLLSVSLCPLWSCRRLWTKWSIPIFIIQSTSFSKFQIEFDLPVCFPKLFVKAVSDYDQN